MAKPFDQKVSELSTNGYSFSIGNYISEGFNIFGRFAGGFIGYILLLFVISIGMSIIPVLGQIASMLISPVLLAGFFIVAHRIKQGQDYSFNNFFDGFKSDWIQLFLANIIGLAVMLLLFLPIIPTYYLWIQSFQEAMAAGEVLDPADLQTDFPTWMLIYLTAASLIAAYLGISWTMAQFHIIFYDQKAWQALEASRKIVHRRWWMWFLFLLLSGIVAMLGVIGLVVGLLITYPAVLCAMYAAYADVMDLGSDEKMDETSHFIA